MINSEQKIEKEPLYSEALKNTLGKRNALVKNKTLEWSIHGCCPRQYFAFFTMKMKTGHIVCI